MSGLAGPLKLGRLTQRRDFLLVAASGRRQVAPGLVLQARARDPQPTPPTGRSPAPPVHIVRVGFTATRKIGSAVIRNRARRRLREAARAALPAGGAPGFDYVLIARADTVKRPYQALLADLRGALATLAKRGAPR